LPHHRIFLMFHTTTPAIAGNPVTKGGYPQRSEDHAATAPSSCAVSYRNAERLADFFSEVSTFLKGTTPERMLSSGKIDDAINGLKHGGQTQEECKKEINQMFKTLDGLRADLSAEKQEAINKVLNVFNAVCDSLNAPSDRLASEIDSASLQIRLISANASTNVDHATNAPPTVSGRAVWRQALEFLKIFNRDPDILYIAELRRRPDANKINQGITKTVEGYGFQRVSDEEYRYTGGDPASALRNLLGVRPLVLDCTTALNLVIYHALLKALGDTFFNTYIKKVFDGVLSTANKTPPRFPASEVVHYSALHEQNDNLLPQNLQTGDLLWIQGPADGYAFHQASDCNAYNVVVETSDSGQPYLVGFDSASSPTHGRWSYAELRSLLWSAYHSPLTLRDLLSIETMRESPQQKARYSSLTYKDAYEWLEKTQPEALSHARKLLKDKHVDLDKNTKLYAPKSDFIRGVVQIVTPHDACSFNDFITSKKDRTIVVFNPVIPPGKRFVNLIPGFKTDFPHQRKIYAAVEEFYNRCIAKKSQRNERQYFDSLILFGNTGTGKTMACEALLHRLEEKNHVIWKTDFSDSVTTLLSFEEQEQLLLVTKTTVFDEACCAALIDKLKPVWDKVDIIFINGTKRNSYLRKGICNAALRYARETGKKVLITSNNDPFSDFQSDIKLPFDAITFCQIEGPDYRAENAGNSAARVSEQTGNYEISIAQYLKEYSTKMKNVDRSKDVFETEDFSFELHTKYDKALKEFKNVSKDILKKIGNCQEILVDMTGCEYDSRYRPLIQRMLDVMDTRPDYKATIVSDRPQKTVDNLKKMIAEVDADKYVPILRRVVIQR